MLPWVYVWCGLCIFDFSRFSLLIWPIYLWPIMFAWAFVWCGLLMSNLSYSHGFCMICIWPIVFHYPLDWLVYIWSIFMGLLHKMNILDICYLMSHLSRILRPISDMSAFVLTWHVLLNIFDVACLCLAYRLPLGLQPI